MAKSSPRVKRTFTGSNVSRVVLLPLMAGLEGTAVALDQVLSKGGLRPRDLEDPNLRLPRELAGDLWRYAVELTGDEAFGLHAAERMPLGTMEIVEYLVRNSPSVREAIERMTRYAPLLADELSFELFVGEAHARLSYHAGSKAFPPVASEFILAIVHRFSARTLALPIPPREVWFTHPEPADMREHIRVFGMKPRFEAALNALVFDKGILDARLADADEKLGTVLDHQASRLLEQIPRPAVLSARVRQLIARELSDGDATAGHIARKLNMSTRTLHRKLRESGVSHRVLLDEVRHMLALRYLEQAEKSLSEIAQKLGFSDLSAFRKAFKRWTGTTLAEYRKP